MNIFSELDEIGRMLTSASMLATVRQEVAKLKREGFIVTDGQHQDGCEQYEVIVRCGSEDDLVSRRLREKMPDTEITRIAAGLVGLKKSRRK